MLIKLINLYKDTIENEFADYHGDAIVQIRGETQDKKEMLTVRCLNLFNKYFASNYSHIL